MFTLVTGGSGSGKSAFAEDEILRFGQGKRIYVATMMSFDEESRKRIARHRRMRSSKEFETLECYTGLERQVFRMTALFFWSVCQTWWQMKCMPRRSREAYGGSGFERGDLPEGAGAPCMCGDK